MPCLLSRALGALGIALMACAAPLRADVPPPDPAATVSYPCSYAATWIWNYPGDGVGLVTARVRYPSATCDSADGPPAQVPALIFAHGNAMSNTDHDTLMRHLTRNGFVTASIENAGDNETRARAMISFLDSLHTYWGFQDRLSTRTVFMGHSRGGEAAVTAARLLAENPALGAQNYDVRAVVSLAPTDGGGQDGDDPRESLTGAMTHGYLAIYGSLDTDVKGGTAFGVGPAIEPQRTAFALYDRAGSEGSADGLLLPGVHVDKAMVYVYGFGHRVFLDGNQGSPAGRNVAQAFVNAFLRWQALDQAEYRGFFDGRFTSPTLAGQEIYTQLASGARRVIDNFEDAALGTNTMGDTLTQGGSDDLALVGDEAYELLRSSPADTRAIRATWSGPSAWLRWGIPTGLIGGAGERRDVSGFTHLSLRVAQVYAHVLNVPAGERDFHVRIFTSAGFSPKVRASDHGRVPEPDAFLCPLLSCGPMPPVDYTKSAFTTLRIPLSAFTGANLADVRSVYLYFDAPGHPTGALLLDNLEFTR